MNTDETKNIYKLRGGRGSVPIGLVQELSK
jgi:hypothetical protein